MSFKIKRRIPMSGNNTQANNDAKLFSQTDLETAMREVLSKRDDMILEKLRDEGMLKEESEPGTFKKFLAGVGRKVTKHIDAIVDDGEEVLMRNTVSSAKEKSMAKELEAARKAIEAKYK